MSIALKRRAFFIIQRVNNPLRLYNGAFRLYNKKGSSQSFRKGINMAKQRLDWFKLDCQCDEKLELIEAEFGLEGFAAVIKLFQRIYGGEGYYCIWNEDMAMVFSRRIGISTEKMSAIVERCVQREIFDRRLYEEKGILTSHGIQKRYYECTERRKNARIRPEYLLLTEVNSGTDENVCISEKNDCISSTEEKREEEKRAEETRTEEKREEDSSALLSALEKEYGREAVERCSAKVKEWYSRNGRRLTDLPGTVRKWLEKDGAPRCDPNIDKYKQFINVF